MSWNCANMSRTDYRGLTIVFMVVEYHIDTALAMQFVQDNLGLVDWIQERGDPPQIAADNVYAVASYDAGWRN